MIFLFNILVQLFLEILQFSDRKLRYFDFWHFHFQTGLQVQRNLLYQILR